MSQSVKTPGSGTGPLPPHVGELLSSVSRLSRSPEHRGNQLVSSLASEAQNNCDGAAFKGIEEEKAGER